MSADHDPWYVKAIAFGLVALVAIYIAGPASRWVGDQLRGLRHQPQNSSTAAVEPPPGRDPYGAIALAGNGLWPR